MPRKKNVDMVAMAVGVAYTPPPAPALKSQARYGGEPWKPGERPRAPLRTVIAGPKYGAPYGEEMAVCPPDTRGSTAGTPGEPE